MWQVSESMKFPGPSWRMQHLICEIFAGRKEIPKNCQLGLSMNRLGSGKICSLRLPENVVSFRKTLEDKVVLELDVM